MLCTIMTLPADIAVSEVASMQDVGCLLTLLLPTAVRGIHEAVQEAMQVCVMAYGHVVAKQ